MAYIINDENLNHYLQKTYHSLKILKVKMCEEKKIISSDNESGYSSDVSSSSNEDGHFCPFCRRHISGPRVGLVIHFGRIHSEKTLHQISQYTKVSGTHKIVKIRNRLINQTLTV